MFKGIVVAASVAALAMLGGTTAANASTSVIPFNHSVVVNSNGTDYFQATSPVVNAPVNAGPANSVDDNFVVLASGPNSVHFALFGSNLCLADPGSGYGAVDQVQLRTCNGKQWQAFRVVSQGNHLSGLQSVATNQFIQDNGQFNGLTTNADNRNCAVGVPCPAGTVGQNTFSGNPNQEWSFGHFFPNFARVSATQSEASAANGINSSLTYSYDVSNTGNAPAHVDVNATEVATVVVSNSNNQNTFADGTYTVTLTQGVESDQLVLAHSSVTDTNLVTLADPGSASNVTGPGNYDKSLTSFVQDAGSHSASVTVHVVETPSITANVNGHFTQHVHVHPATEVADF